MDGDIGDGESLSGLGELVQGSPGTVERVGAATLGGRDEMVTVVTHRIFLPGSMFRCSKDRRRSCNAAVVHRILMTQNHTGRRVVGCGGEGLVAGFDLH